MQLFLDMKRYDCPDFDNKEWMCDFGFLLDMNQHLNEVNMKLNKGQFIHNL